MMPEENLLRAIEDPAGYWEERCAAAEDECGVLRKRIDALEAERAEMPAIYAVQDWVDADGIHDGWRTSNGFFFSDRSHAEESLDYLAREHPNTEFRLAETRTTPWRVQENDR